MTLSFIKDKREIKALRRDNSDLREALKLAREHAKECEVERGNAHEAAMFHSKQSDTYLREINNLHDQLRGVSVSLSKAETDCLIWKSRALALESRIKALIAQYESALNFTEVEEISDAE